MGKLLGLTLITSGIAVAGVTVLLADHLDARPAPAGDVVEVVAAPPVMAPAAPPPAGVAKATLGERPGKAGPVATVAEPAARKPVAFETVTVPNDPIAIARALQIELRRVGCYDGETHGIWSTASRKAMRAFTDRVNASLPIDRPDFILLSLVQAHPGQACGAGCPSGQVTSEAGKCVPAAIVAHAQRKVSTGRLAHATAPAVPGVIRETLPDLTPPPAPLASLSEPRQPSFTDPRMGLAGPMLKPDEKPEEKLAAEAKERKARRERERRIVRDSKPAAFGQTRWARDFFRKIDGATF